MLATIGFLIVGLFIAIGSMSDGDKSGGCFTVFVILICFVCLVVIAFFNFMTASL